MNHIISFIIGYLLGSVPTAYILLKKSKGIDITEAGSGSVGAHNSYLVSRSKLIGSAVFLIDLSKGFLSAYLAVQLFGADFIYPMLSLIGGVLAHCYSPWIKFKGGRGLATAGGGAIYISLPLLLLWMLLWLISYAFRRNIHFSNFSASILSGALAVSSAEILNKYSAITASTNFEFSLLVNLLFIIILSKHIAPIKEYITSLNKKKGY